MVSLSKGLGGPIGSMLAGAASCSSRGARRARKAFGGGMRQVGVLAAAGLVGLDSLPRLREDHELARWIAGQLAGMAELSCSPERAETNMVLVEVERDGPPAAWWQERLSELDVLLLAMGPRHLRIVTHRDVRPARGRGPGRGIPAGRVAPAREGGVVKSLQYSIGVLLQLSGLATTLVPCVALFNPDADLRQMLILFGFGGGVFFLGWMLVRSSRD